MRDATAPSRASIEFTNASPKVINKLKGYYSLSPIALSNTELEMVKEPKK